MKTILHNLHSTSSEKHQDLTDTPGLLSFYFTTDNISISNYHKGENLFTTVSSYTLLQNTLPESEHLKELALSGGKYHEVSLIFSSTKFTLVPKELFVETEKERYLELVCNLTSTDVISTSEIPELKAVLVTTIDKVLLNIAKIAFPKANIMHHFQIFLKFVMKNPLIKASKTWVYFRKKSFDVIVQSNQGLRLMNSIAFETKEEAVYHILNIYQQLQLDPTEIPMVLCGEIVEESPVYEMIFRYFAQVEIWQASPEITADLNFSDMPSAFYFTLLNAPGCV